MSRPSWHRIAGPVIRSNVLVWALVTGCAADPQELLRAANERFEAKEYAGAIEWYTAALDAEPGLRRAWNNRGLSHLALGDLRSAFQDLDEAVRMGAPSPEVYCNLGIVHFRSGDYLRATAAFDDALRLHPEYLRARAGRGLARLRGGDPDGAAQDFRQVLESAPADWPERSQVEAELKRLPPRKS
jgi:tetratricopeptide (TPR) repeat protein